MILANGDVILYKGTRVTVKKIMLHTVYPKYSVVSLEDEDGSLFTLSVAECENLSYREVLDGIKYDIQTINENGSIGNSYYAFYLEVLEYVNDYCLKRIERVQLPLDLRMEMVQQDDESCEKLVLLKSI